MHLNWYQYEMFLSDFNTENETGGPFRKNFYSYLLQKKKKNLFKHVKVYFQFILAIVIKRFYIFNVKTKKSVFLLIIKF